VIHSAGCGFISHLPARPAPTSAGTSIGTTGDFAETNDCGSSLVSNAQAWTAVTYDPTPYKGQTIRLYFKAHGDGYGD
jgi:hypothetical protein